MITYVIKTKSNEYYCGKTNDLDKRILEHLNEKKPHWFAFKNRKNFKVIFQINGDYEKKIKKFGIKNLMKVINASTLTGGG